jgi:hypothetical protein
LAGRQHHQLDNSGQMLVVYRAEAGSESEQALALLASMSATESSTPSG